MLGTIEARRGDTTFAMDDDGELALAAVGDRQAFLILYVRFVAPVERYVAARTGSSDVEDIVSITFTRALSRIHTYRPDRGSFAAWLFTIARNAVVDRYREAARLTELDSDVLEPGDSAGPETIALEQDEARRVREALAYLSQDQRDALALRYAAELPFAAVALTLGKSEAAAKMLVQRGLQTLKRRLERENSDDR